MNWEELFVTCQLSLTLSMHVYVYSLPIREVEEEEGGGDRRKRRRRNTRRGTPGRSQQRPPYCNLIPRDRATRDTL